MPKLTSLDIAIEFRTLADLMPLLTLMPSLESFRIIMTSTGMSFRFPSTLKWPKCHINSLSVVFLDRNASRYDYLNLRALVQQFQICFPFKTLEMHILPLGLGLYPYIASLITSLQMLNLLNLMLPEDIFNDFKIKSSSLIRCKVTIESGHAVEPLHDWLECPELSSLHLSLGEDDLEGIIISHVLDILPESNPKIKGLYLSGHRLGGKMFQSLESLTLTDNMAITQLFFRLINTPEQLPMLEHVGLLAPLDWQLLFRMLERRNFLPRNDINMTKTLCFPSTISLTLLRPLTKLLLGHFTTRPEKQDISFDSLSDIYLEKNMCVSIHPLSL